VEIQGQGGGSALAVKAPAAMLGGGSSRGHGNDPRARILSRRRRFPVQPVSSDY
jgi:hypothetical protein